MRVGDAKPEVPGQEMRDDTAQRLEAFGVPKDQPNVEDEESFEEVNELLLQADLDRWRRVFGDLEPNSTVPVMDIGPEIREALCDILTYLWREEEKPWDGHEVAVFSRIRFVNRWLGSPIQDNWRWDESEGCWIDIS